LIVKSTRFDAFIFYLQYNIKKKEEQPELAPPEPDNPLMRKKKTPEELAREAEAEEEDDFTSESQPVRRGSKDATQFALSISLFTIAVAISRTADSVRFLFLRVFSFSLPLSCFSGLELF